MDAYQNLLALGILEDHCTVQEWETIRENAKNPVTADPTEPLNDEEIEDQVVTEDNPEDNPLP